jgi:O-antigen biosynthesis protein WbqP
MVYAAYGKRVLDCVLAALGLVALSPLLALVALAIRIDDGEPLLFRQQRVGRHGHAFTLYKFRSMPVSAPNVPSAAAGGLTVTRVGKFIRRTNIDELPQLWNVLIGDMSLIGPRPALPSQSSLLLARRKQHVDRLRPGLTGLAQVNAYDGMPETEKVAWETRYAHDVSLFRDIWIVLRTLRYLTRRPPVY